MNIDVEDLNFEHLYTYTHGGYSVDNENIRVYKGNSDSIYIHLQNGSVYKLTLSQDQADISQDTYFMNQMNFDNPDENVIGIYDDSIVALSTDNEIDQNYLFNFKTLTVTSYDLLDNIYSNNSIDLSVISNISLGDEIRLEYLQSKTINNEWVFLNLQASGFTNNSSPWEFWFVRYNIMENTTNLIRYDTPPVVETIPHDIVIEENGENGYFIHTAGYSKAPNEYFRLDFESNTLHRINMSSILTGDESLRLIDIKDNYLYLQKNSGNAAGHVFKMNLQNSDWSSLEVEEMFYGDHLILDNYIVKTSLYEVTSNNSILPFNSYLLAFIILGLFTRSNRRLKKYKQSPNSD